MALLSAQTVVRAGLAVVFDPASVGGDTFRPTSDRAKALVRNDSGGSITVTIVTPGTVAGLAIADTIVAVAAGVIAAIPLYQQLYAHPTTGLITITYSAVTDVDIAVITD